MLLLLLPFVPPSAARPTTPARPPAGKQKSPSYVAEEDVAEIIAKYKRVGAAEQVAAWAQSSRSVSRAASPEFRAAAVRNLPAAWIERRDTSAGVDGPLRTLFGPLWSLYGRDYTIVLIDTHLPAIMIDSGTLLIVTTGLLSRATSDDELLGFAAHEAAHAQFAWRSVAAKEIYAKAVERHEADSPGAREALRELSRIELECDAMAARTLFVLGKDPRQFVRSVERINKEFPEETGRGAEMGANWHPPTVLRRRVVEALAEGETTRQSELRPSPLLREIQAALRGAK